MNDTQKVWVLSGETFNEDAQAVLLLKATPTQQWTEDNLRLMMQGKMARLMEESESLEADLETVPDVASEARLQTGVKDKAAAIVRTGSLGELIDQADLKTGPERASLKQAKEYQEQTLQSLMLSLANAL